jgi:putative PEP-CTERM system TPR-repeat lipoprotein
VRRAPRAGVALAGVALACCLACTPAASREQYLESGKRYFAAGKVAEAIIEFRNAVSRDPRWGDARFQLAEAYAAHGEPELAYREYIRAADLLPEDAAAQLKAAAYLLLARQYDDAKARAERVLAAYARNVDAQITLASAFAGLRQVDAAIAHVTAAIQLDPSRSESYITLSRIRFDEGRADEARRAIERAVEVDRRSVTARLAQANLYWSTGDPQRAEAALEAALALEPENMLTRRALATLYLADGRPDDAEPHLKHVAEKTESDAARLSLADFYLTRRAYDDARAVLLPLTARDATRGAAEARLAQITYSQGMVSEAYRSVDALLARDPANAFAHTLRAQWSLADGDAEKALEHARLALAANPQLAPALVVKADAETRTHRTSDAVRTLLELLQLDPRDADAQTRLALLHLAQNQIDSAIHVAGEALTNAPASVEARLALVRGLMAQGDLKAAAVALAPAKKAAPDSAAVWLVDGALRLQQRDRRAAQASFVRALQSDPQSREALRALIRLDLVNGEVAAARSRLEPRLSALDNDPAMLVSAANVWLASGDAGRAEQMLRRAVSLDPLAIDGVAALARLLTRERRLEPALAEFDAAAAAHPQQIAAPLMSAVLLHTLGRLDEAERRYLAVLKLEPRAALAANNLAAIYAARPERLADAQRYAELAAEHAPASAAVQDTLGTVLLQRSLIGPAVAAFRRSTDIDPSEALHHYHLGVALTRDGDSAGAREALQRALDLNPRFEAARHALRALR